MNVDLCRRESDCWWRLLLENVEEISYEIRRLSCGQKWKENWSPNSCDANLLDYAIWDMMKKMLYKNVKWHEDNEGLSAAISDAWDRLTKKSINNSIGQW